jgi:hypothetical protein
MVEVWQPKCSATIIRLNRLFAHGDGLPCRSLGTTAYTHIGATTEVEDVMEIDKDKVDEITLALLYLTTCEDRHGLRSWKSHSGEVLDRLHESGQIYEPATKARSVMLTEEGGELWLSTR